ncbi:MAG: RluA family pseudouridine synthase [Firmicutes bacterium]|nr:RluA family pseudouridine synthase [Bacillota bacterium]
MIEILYQDKSVIVCIKPVGVLSQADGQESMVSLLAAQCGGGVYPIHRLDRSVGGVMVFARNSMAAGKLSADIQSGRFVKQYMAAVHGRPQEACGVMKDILFKDSRKNKSFVVNRPRKGTKDASLEYTLIDTTEYKGSECSLVRIKLHTGRTHQIRVQFASRGMPLLGDGKYGSRENHCDTALWSYKITFRNPSDSREMSFESLPDKERYPWNLFDWEKV